MADIIGTISNNFSPSWRLLNHLFVIIGYWMIFKKCGVKGVYSVIPVVREYHIGLCADREKDGKTYAILNILIYLLYVVEFLIPESNKNLKLFLVVPLLGTLVALYIYMLRISMGLIKIFNKERRWIWCFIVLEGVTVLYWGFSKKFVPEKQVVNLKEVKGAKVLGKQIEPVPDALTVNIEDRTVIDFFRKKTLLKDIHMIIPKGHMVLLLGGSGAGKTTYVNALTGYEKANANISLDKHDVYTEFSKMKYDIGFVPQQDLMRGNDTVYMTLRDAANMRLSKETSPMEKENRIARMLSQFGLESVKNSLVEKLSGGQRKRLSIAIEFVSDPTLFILDEPDSGLDGVVARNLFESLRDIADEGKIVVVITHTPDRVIDLFDDVIVLAKDARRTGRLAWYGPVNEAYEFFGKSSMEEILLSINQKDEGGEGKADEFVEKYADRMKEKIG